jgi:hypothetical protein
LEQLPLKFAVLQAPDRKTAKACEKQPVLEQAHLSTEKGEKGLPEENPVPLFTNSTVSSM